MIPAANGHLNIILWYLSSIDWGSRDLVATGLLDRLCNSTLLRVQAQQQRHLVRKSLHLCCILVESGLAPASRNVTLQFLVDRPRVLLARAQLCIQWKRLQLTRERL